MLRRGITCKTAQTAQEARGVAYTLTTCSPAAEAAEMAAAAAESAGLAVPPPQAPPHCCPTQLAVFDPLVVVAAAARGPPGQRRAEEAAELQERRARAPTQGPPWLQLCPPPVGSPTAPGARVPVEQLAPDPTAVLAGEQTMPVSSTWQGRGGSSAAQAAAGARGAEPLPEDVLDRLHASAPDAGRSATSLHAEDGAPAKALAYQELMAAGAARATEARQAPAIQEALHGMVPTPQVRHWSSCTRHGCRAPHHRVSDCPCPVVPGLKALRCNDSGTISCDH